MISIMQQVMKDYEEIREKNKRDLENKKKNIYNLIPRIKEIDEEMVKLSIHMTKAILNNSVSSKDLLEELRGKQLELKAEKIELLVGNRYPKDYLDMKYSCSICNDTGYIGTDKCSCLMPKLIKYSYKQSNLSSQLSKENFDMFRFDYYSDKAENGNISPRDNMKEIYMKCVKFSQDFDNHSNNLFLVGRPGLGKTFLCNSIAKELLDKGKAVIYQSSSDLIDLVRKYKFDFESEEENSKYLYELYNSDLLIIDDLGTELSTQFSGLVIYNIINKRLLNDKKTIISTNLSIEDIMKTYSERIYSRIFGNFSICKFYGDDIRFKLDTRK